MSNFHTLVRSYATTTDFSASVPSYGYAVKMTGTSIVICSTANEAAVGIILGHPNTSQTADVLHYGICKAVAGAAVTQGDNLTVDTSGRLVTASGTNTYVVAKALAAATGANELFEVLLTHAGKLP